MSRKRSAPDATSNGFQIQLLCPINCIGKVIGQSGSVIAELRKETGATIKVLEHVVHVTPTEASAPARRPEEMRPITVRAVEDRPGEGSECVVEAATLRIMGCMQPGLLLLGEDGRRHRRAKHSNGCDKTSATGGRRSDGNLGRDCVSGTEDGAVTVALLVNAFAAGLLSGEATQQLHSKQGTAVDLRQCSVPSHRVLTLSGLPAAVLESAVHTLDTLRGHPEASEALDLSQTMAGILSPPNMRQQPSTAPVSRPISRTGLLPERMHDRPEAYPFRQPLPPAQLPAGSHGPGNTPPTRYRLLVPVQLVSPLLGPGGGIDECVKAYDGAMITFSNSMLGGPDRLVTIASSSGDVAADSLQHIVGCVLHLPLEEARIAAEAGALRLLVTAQQAKTAAQFLHSSPVSTTWVTTGRGDEAALRLRGTPAAALAAFRNVAHLLDAWQPHRMPEPQDSLAVPTRVYSTPWEAKEEVSLHGTPPRFCQGGQWAQLHGGVWGAIGHDVPQTVFPSRDSRQPVVLPPPRPPRPVQGLPAVQIFDTSTPLPSRFTAPEMHTPVHHARLVSHVAHAPPPPPPRLNRYRSRMADDVERGNSALSYLSPSANLERRSDSDSWVTPSRLKRSVRRRLYFGDPQPPQPVAPPLQHPANVLARQVSLGSLAIGSIFCFSKGSSSNLTLGEDQPRMASLESQQMGALLEVRGINSSYVRQVPRVDVKLSDSSADARQLRLRGSASQVATSRGTVAAHMFNVETPQLRMMR